MTNLFFNTAIISNNSSRLGQWANDCFAPVRLLLHGRTVEIWNQTVIREEKNLPSRQWIITAAAILLLVPGLLVGTITKLLDYTLFASVHTDALNVQKFDQDPHPLDDGISLEVSHIRLDKMATSIKNKLTSKEAWNEPTFIREVSAYMEAASDEIEMLFDQLEERYGGDPDKMAKALAGNGLSYDMEEEDSDPSLYCYYLNSRNNRNTYALCSPYL